MRIAIVTNFLYPEGLGGTELYCYQLANALLTQGHEVYWFVPNFNNSATKVSTYENGLKIVRFAAIESGRIPEAKFVSASFIKEMKERQITVAHFNEFGGFEGISTSLLCDAKRAGISTIVTLHTVHYLCWTGTMRYAGHVPCDGKVIPTRCGACHVFSNYSPSGKFNYLLSNTFKTVFDIMDRRNLHPLPNIRRAMNSFKDRIVFIESLKEGADRIVSLTQWFKEVLIINGIPEVKIMYIPQASPISNPVKAVQQRDGFVFISRINKEKGINLLLKAAAILQRKDPAIYIDVYGPIPEGNAGAQSFLKKIKTISNIRYKKVLPPEEVMSVIAKHKAVLLPSLVSEMAPMIIMEANKLQTPVIGSDVPGTAELINQYQSGLIFKYNDASDFADKILAVENGVCNFTFTRIQNDFNDIAGKYLEIYAT